MRGTGVNCSHAHGTHSHSSVEEGNLITLTSILPAESSPPAPLHCSSCTGCQFPAAFFPDAFAMTERRRDDYIKYRKE